MNLDLPKDNFYLPVLKPKLSSRQLNYKYENIFYRR